MKKQKIYIICGLPGSGKTYLGQKLANEKFAIFVDDPKDISFFTYIIQNGKDVVVADPNFCIKNIRKSAIKTIKSIAPKAKIIYYYFENKPNKCINNVMYRQANGDTRNVIQSIKQYSIMYSIPKNAKILSIWQND